MSTIFTWTITRMQCLAQADWQTDVVIVASWNCNGAVVQNNVPYASDYSGTLTFTLDPSVPITPFNQLTQDQVLGWVWQEPNLKQTVESNVSSQLDRLINPPVTTPPLPWSN